MDKILAKDGKPVIPPILKEDLLEKTLTPRKGDGEVLKIFKQELSEHIKLNAGCIAFAKKMCDEPEFYKFVKGAMAERERSGYKSQAKSISYSFSNSGMFNLHTALQEIREGKSSNYLNMPSRIVHGRMTYNELVSYEKSDPEVQREKSALDTLYEEYPEELKRRLSSFTLHDGMLDNMAATFMLSLVRHVWERHLYKDEFKFADIGTGSGEFSDEFVSFIRERFSKYRIVRTNPVELEIAHQKDLKVRIHDICKEPLGEKFNVVIIKDVMKFFEEGEPKGAIWGNVRQSVEEGGVILSGSGGVFKVHVMCHGELRKVAADAFLRKLDKINGYEKYLENLDDIVSRSNYGLITRSYRK